jgi:hypothetical protein
MMRGDDVYAYHHSCLDVLMDDKQKREEIIEIEEGMSWNVLLLP